MKFLTRTKWKLSKRRKKGKRQKKEQKRKREKNTDHLRFEKGQ